MSLHHVSLSPQTSDIWQCHTHTHSRALQNIPHRETFWSENRRETPWQTSAGYAFICLFLPVLSLEKNKSWSHRRHRWMRTNGWLTCQRRWGVRWRKGRDERGVEWGKAWWRWKKRGWQGLGLLAYLWGQIFCSTSVYLSPVAPVQSVTQLKINIGDLGSPTHVNK